MRNRKAGDNTMTPIGEGIRDLPHKSKRRRMLWIAAAISTLLIIVGVLFLKHRGGQDQTDGPPPAVDTERARSSTLREQLSGLSTGEVQ